MLVNQNVQGSLSCPSKDALSPIPKMIEGVVKRHEPQM